MSQVAEKHPKRKPAPEPSEAPPRRRESLRDFAEQVVVAFILAFLVRGFEAEAFVIPTGSMAPTLMGAHKEIACPHCGYTFTVNASEESEPGRAGAVLGALCGNCRGPVRIDTEPSFNGDRILVMKFLYDLPWVGSDGPERWDVVVFHYPEEPETNYIKRLVGMPGEELVVQAGDVLIRPLDGSKAIPRLLHKPPRHQRAMQQMVWDDRYRPEPLADRPEWRRWRSPDPKEWAEATPGTFLAASAPDRWSELRYRHLVPDLDQWQQILAGEPTERPPHPALVSDFYAYNSATPFLRSLFNGIAPHWVGDLSLTARVVSRSDVGKVRLELVRAGVPYRVEVELASGSAQLFRGDEPIGEPATTPMKGAGDHVLEFANVDGRLTVWVDHALSFGDGYVYNEGEGYVQASPAPTEADLQPAAVASLGAEVEVSDLVLKRDIYYTVEPGEWDYEALGLSRSTDLSNPGEFPALARSPRESFPIQPGHFMMFGDNSPRSKDSRGWGAQDRTGYRDSSGRWVKPWASADKPGRRDWEVPESLIIGKAFFVYWPHGKPFWPSLTFGRNVRFPFRPYVERMKWIR